MPHGTSPIDEIRPCQINKQHVTFALSFVFLFGTCVFTIVLCKKSKSYTLPMGNPAPYPAKQSLSMAVTNETEFVDHDRTILCQ